MVLREDYGGLWWFAVVCSNLMELPITTCKAATLVDVALD